MNLTLPIGMDAKFPRVVRDGVARRLVGPAGQRISYLTGAGSSASAETILLIHGAGMSAQTWTGQLRGLSPGVRAVAIDLPGHGASDPGPELTLEGYADAAARLIETLGVGPVFVGGHSLGGGVALMIAARRPDLVKGLVLVSSCARLPQSNAAMDALLGYVPQPLRKFLFLSAAQRTLFAHGASNPAIELGLKDLRSCPPETVRSDVAAAKAMDLEDVARNIRVSTLILCGSADVLTPVASSRRLAELIAGSKIHLVEGAGHMLPLEQPDRIDQEILEFVESVAGTEVPRVTATEPESFVRRLIRDAVAVIRPRRDDPVQRVVGKPLPTLGGLHHGLRRGERAS